MDENPYKSPTQVESSNERPPKQSYSAVKLLAIFSVSGFGIIIGLFFLEVGLDLGEPAMIACAGSTCVGGIFLAGLGIYQLYVWWKRRR